MVNGGEKSAKEGGFEKTSRWLRNINAIGAVALGAAGVALESTVLTALAAINAGQAAFFEVTRRWAKKRKSAKKMGGLALRPA